jgi:hypothetical protein
MKKYTTNDVSLNEEQIYDHAIAVVHTIHSNCPMGAIVILFNEWSELEEEGFDGEDILALENATSVGDAREVGMGAVVVVLK